MWFNAVLGIIGMLGFAFMLAIFAITLSGGKPRRPQKQPTIFTLTIDSTKKGINRSK